MSVTRVAYAAAGWGEGELWYEGPRLVWHELPHPRAEQPRRSAGSTRAHPRPGGGVTRRPSRSTLPGDHARAGVDSVPDASQLVQKLRAYFDGARVGFDDVELPLDDLTPFQRAVAAAMRHVGWGSVISYGELARVAGYPNAQRAAGTFCAHNRFPLILPCHRVVAAEGIGRYGTLGVEYKRRLLELEGVTL